MIILVTIPGVCFYSDFCCYCLLPRPFVRKPDALTSTPGAAAAARTPGKGTSEGLPFKMFGNDTSEDTLGDHAGEETSTGCGMYR